MEPNNLTEQNPVNPQAPAQQQPAQPKPQANPAAAMPNAAPQPAAARPQTVQQPHPGMSQPQAQGGASKESLWYLDNYILLKDYYDRTISRIAARCVRMGNIAMEEYPFTDIFWMFWRKSAIPAIIFCNIRNYILMWKRKLPAA